MHWNETARSLVIASELDPLLASRTYALVSLAQLKAASVAAGAPESARLPPRAAEKFAALAISQASIEILGDLFDGTFNPHWRGRELEEIARSSGLGDETIRAAFAIGELAARDLLLRRANDLVEPDDEVAPPAGPARWRSLEGHASLRPTWGELQPFMIASVERYIPPPPPPPSSAELENALREVKTIGAQLTEEQERSAQFWADGAGTATPTGHWNEIACDLLVSSRRSELELARVLAALNLAMFDAGVVCWRTKYKYWLARPSQLDESIKPILRVPNFPSYVSGHSSFSGAAAEILSHFFARETKKLWKLAREASISRVLAGIHFRVDCDVGLALGKRVGADLIAELTRDPRSLLAH